MATNANRDVTVNLKGDASSLLKAAKDAEGALNQLRLVAQNLAQSLGNISVALGTNDLGAVIGKQTAAASAFVERWTTDAQGRVVQYGQTVKEVLPAGFDAAQAAAAQMTAATAQGFNRITVSIDAAGRMKTKVSQDMINSEQKLSGYISEVLNKLSQMGLSSKFQDQLTFSTKRYNDQLISTKQYLNEITRIQKSAMISQEAGARRTKSDLYASTAAMVMLGKRALRVGKDIMGAFTETSKSLYRMQLVMGGTAEDLSKLKFAGDQVGVTAKELTTRWGLLEAHLAKNDQYAKRLGVSYKELDGSVKSPLKLLGEIGDRLNGVTDAMKRSTMAREVFGRGYQAILPLLRQGSAGLKELADNAEKYGLVLDQKAMESGFRFQMQTKQLKQTMSGLGMAVAQSVVPALSTLVGIMTRVINAVRQMYTGTNAFSRVLQIVVPIVGLLAGALTLVAVAFKVAKVASTLFNASLLTNPITILIMIVVALGAAMVWLAKNVSWGIDVWVAFGQEFGAVGGAIVSVGAIIVAAILKIVQGIAWLGEKLGWIPGLGKLKEASKSLKDWSREQSQTFTDLAVSATQAGIAIGGNFGRKAGEAIKNMHMPTLADLLTPPGEEPEWDKDKGGGGGAKEAKNKILTMFEQMVTQARDALNTVREKALAAKKEMDDLAKSVGESLRNAFSLTDIAAGGYMGPKGLMRVFRRRLEDMRAFVANVKKLQGLGLPGDMLMDIVNAGVSGGAQIARMLVANPQVIGELASLNEQIGAETAAAGRFVAQAQYGPQIASYVQDALTRQAQFGQLVVAGAPLGYKPTSEDIEAMTSNISNQIYMDIGTDASPAEIEAAIAWALRTGSVRAPRSSGRGGGGGAAGGGGSALNGPGRRVFGGSININGLQGPTTGVTSGPPSGPPSGLQGPTTGGGGGTGGAGGGGGGLQGPTTGGGGGGGGTW